MLTGELLFFSTVAAIKMNDTLRELFLADNKLMPSDGIQLGNMLKLNHTLHVLDVRNNHLQVSDTYATCTCNINHPRFINRGHGLQIVGTSYKSWERIINHGNES